MSQEAAVEAGAAAPSSRSAARANSTVALDAEVEAAAAARAADCEQCEECELPHTPWGEEEWDLEWLEGWEEYLREIPDDRQLLAVFKTTAAEVMRRGYDPSSMFDYELD